jgi:hypothetical protein
MQQRSKKQTRVRVFAFALVKSRESAAKVAGGRTARGKDTTVPQVLAEWIDGVAELRGTSDDTTALQIVERLRGKPLALLAKDGAA